MPGDWMDYFAELHCVPVRPHRAVLVQPRPRSMRPEFPDGTHDSLVLCRIHCIYFVTTNYVDYLL